MANITAHELPSGDGEKMRADDPTNDPRPFFRRTLTNNSITNPPFTRKSNLNNIAKSRFHGANEGKANLSHPPKREEASNVANSQFQRSQRATKGHEGDIGERQVVSRSHTQQPHPTLRTRSERVTIFTYASKDKHGQHYRS